MRAAVMEGLRQPLVVRDLPDPECAVPIDIIAEHELTLIGTQGMPAVGYDAMLAMITAGKLSPGDLVTSTLALEEVGAVLATMDDFATIGIPVFDRF